MSNTIQIVKVSECKIVTIIILIIHHGDHDLLLYHLSVVQLEWIKRVGMLLHLAAETDLPSQEDPGPACSARKYLVLFIFFLLRNTVLQIYIYCQL